MLILRIFTIFFITSIISCDNAKFAGKTTPATEEPANASGVEPDENLQNEFEAGKVGEDGKFKIDEILPKVPIVPGSLKIKIGDEIVAVDDNGNIIYDEIPSETTNEQGKPDLTDLEKQKLISGKIDYKEGDIKAKGDNINWKNKPIKILYETLKPNSDKKIDEVILSNMEEEPGDSSDKISTSNTGENNANDNINAGDNSIRSSSTNGNSCSLQFETSESIFSEGQQNNFADHADIECPSGQALSFIHVNFRGGVPQGNLQANCSYHKAFSAPVNPKPLKDLGCRDCTVLCPEGFYMEFVHVNFTKKNEEGKRGNIESRCVKPGNDNIYFVEQRVVKNDNQQDPSVGCNSNEVMVGFHINFSGGDFLATGNLQAYCKKAMNKSCGS